MPGITRLECAKPTFTEACGLNALALAAEFDSSLDGVV